MSPESFLGLMALTAFSILAISNYHRYRDSRYDRQRYDRQLPLETSIDKHGEPIAGVNRDHAWPVQPTFPESDDDRLAALIASGISKSRPNS
jgi:hypothetical protein